MNLKDISVVAMGENMVKYAVLMYMFCISALAPSPGYM